MDGLVKRLEAMPAATTDASGARGGDPVNLVLVGEFETLLAALAARWDESETISLATCWKTVRAFLWGTNYRYSPVSPLHLFGRDQDIALQRTRHSINERLHLRLWLTPLEFAGKSVWVGQVSRDIGVRFTTKAWNLTTHRIDPDVDEARDYVIEDLVQAERVIAAGYVGGVGACISDPARKAAELLWRGPDMPGTPAPWYLLGYPVVWAGGRPRVRPRGAEAEPDRRSLPHRRQAGGDPGLAEPHGLTAVAQGSSAVKAASTSMPACRSTP